MATFRRGGGGPPLGAWGVPLQSRGAPNQTESSSDPSFGAEVNHDEAMDAQKMQHRHSRIAIESDSDSGGEDGDATKVDVESLQASIFGDYARVGKDNDAMNDTGVAKIRGLLVAAYSGGTACLICLERVKGTDFIWDCKAGCFAIFHLTCIQSWARQSLNAAEQRALSRLSQESFPGAAAAAATHWYCPKCRAEYPRLAIPKEYRCFCEKEVNPVPDPWLAPHTCGEKCGKELGGDCGHECNLLCHPGPCPPCPQLVQVACFCGEKAEVRRCGRRTFSCGSICKKNLACESHTCENVCHDGDCLPCTKFGMYPCRCKREVAQRACVDSDFQCTNPCGQELSCKKHFCEKGCHAGSCGECALVGRRSCPCGKVEYKGVACDKVVPTCGSTCEKTLGCSLHKCQERCHSGFCNSTCRVILTKACHCGGLKKQVPCHQDLQCERKCQRLRDCTRHACRKRCCNGDCPSCAEVCGKRLRCGNHKCPAPCHRGMCAPCPVSVKISCACGATSFEVPCGMEKDQKPPRCSKPCQILPSCSHGADCKPHPCHYGQCPPCQLVCNAKLSCGHTCPKSCHGPRPSPNPEYTLKPKKKKKFVEDMSARARVQCPPCLEPVVKQCLGKHSSSERTMDCSAVQEFQCDELCGNPLSCSNHFCTLQCHPINIVDITHELERMTDSTNSVNLCDQCDLQCQKERALCAHPCPLPCHPGNCPPCKILVKRDCYCDTLVHAFDCDKFMAASDTERSKMLSCGGPCHRKLPNCAHMCSDLCHPGVCQKANICHKKVVVRCACQRLKKEWLCVDVQKAQTSGTSSCKEGLRSGLFIGLIPCDQECLRLVAIREAQEEAELLRQRKGKEVEVSKALPNISRKKKSRHQTQLGQNSRMQELQSAVRRWSIIVGIVVIVVLVIYLGIVGLVELNAWMNRRDAIRMKKRTQYPRF
ncbi:unnamed protein product [Calypogeia fissa]